MPRIRITHVLPILTVTSAITFAVAGCDAQKEVTSDVATLEADQAEQIKERVELKESAGSKATDGSQDVNAKSNADAGSKHAGNNDGDKDKDKDEIHNLCADFDSCDACIAGLKSEGDSDGGAKAKCRLAVTGCWTTWDKPIRCGDEEYAERPS